LADRIEARFWKYGCRIMAVHRGQLDKTTSWMKRDIVVARAAYR
jgi:hypothetical protein